MQDTQTPKTITPMRLALVGSLIAAVGLAVGFGGEYVESKALGTVGYFITAAGVTLGGLGVFWGFIWNLIRAPLELGRFFAEARWRSVDPRTGRPWLLGVICLFGFAIASGMLLRALVSAAVPAGQELARPLDRPPDLGALFVMCGTAIALVGLWRMRRWGVWMMAALLAVAPVILIAAGSPRTEWDILVAPIVSLLVGARHYRRMAGGR